MSNDQKIPLPFSSTPSQLWDGNAGSWFSFFLRVGTPSQDFRIFPSTNGQQTLVPVPEGCLASDPPNCGSLRRVVPFKGMLSNGFQTNQSSTWVPNGLFNLGIEDGLNLTGNGEFGFDTIGLGIQNSNGPTLTHQLVAGIATKDFYLSEFGLGPKPANLSSYDEPVPTYMTSLVDQNFIPSHSFGYTAGAKYQLDRVFGSLTLGGFDAARFVAKNLSFPFAEDDSRSLTVGVQSTMASNTLQGAVSPLIDGAFFLIDSSVSDIWLPVSACQLFEQAFGLIYDNATDLYLVNASIHPKLQQLKPTISFKIGVSDFDGATFEITMPYEAFDLQASSPFYPNATNYFPIRRAANSTQYTLGRTFLQEVYIVVDCERSNFTVSQALFLDPFQQQLVAIQSINHSMNTTIQKLTHASRSMGHGAVARVGFGAVIVLILMIALIAFAHRLRGHRFQKSKISELGALKVGREKNADHDAAIWIPELHHENNPRSLPELGGTALSRFELSGSVGVTEMAHNQPDLASTPSSASSLSGALSRLREVHRAESASTARDSDVFPLVLQARLCEYLAIAHRSQPGTSSPSTEGINTFGSSPSHGRPS